MILVAVVDEGFIDGVELPGIFEFQALKQPPTIYSGTFPTIRINTETLTDRDDLKGMGINGILMSEQWYCETRDEKDIFNIAIPSGE